MGSGGGFGLCGVVALVLELVAIGSGYSSCWKQGSRTAKEKRERKKTGRRSLPFFG